MTVRNVAQAASFNRAVSGIHLRGRRLLLPISRTLVPPNTQFPFVFEGDELTSRQTLLRVTPTNRHAVMQLSARVAPFREGGTASVLSGGNVTGFRLLRGNLVLADSRETPEVNLLSFLDLPNTTEEVAYDIEFYTEPVRFLDYLLPTEHLASGLNCRLDIVELS